MCTGRSPSIKQKDVKKVQKCTALYKYRSLNHLQLEYFSSPKICDLLQTSLPFAKRMGNNSIYLFIPAGSSNAFWVMWFSMENFVLEMCMDICVYKRRCNKNLRCQY